MEKRKVLCVIDMQNSFIAKKGILFIKNAETLIEQFNQFIENLSPYTFQAVLLTQDTHSQEEYLKSSESELFPLHCQYNTWDWQLAINLDSISNKFATYIIYKNNFDLWYNNCLPPNKANDTLYKQLFKIRSLNDNSCNLLDDITKLFPPQETIIYLCGVAADYCVYYALQGFLERNYDIKLITPLIKGINQEITAVLANREWEKFIKNNKIELMNTTKIK